MLTLTIRKTVTAHYYASISTAEGQTLLLTPMSTSPSSCSGNIDKITRKQSWTNYLQYRIGSDQQHYIVLLDEDRHILALSPAFAQFDQLRDYVMMIKQSLRQLRASAEKKFMRH